MKRSSIMAHRGLFLSEIEKNSPEALKRALEEGFGIETDLRDLDGEIIISHDPPSSCIAPLRLEWLLEELNLSPCDGRIGLNIKSDGLSRLIESKIRNYGINPSRLFVFDMSIPDSLSYLMGSIPAYSRISEYESQPAFQDKVGGIWVDSFHGSFPQVKCACDLVRKGIRAAIVSAELHGRDRLKLWNEIIETKLHLSPHFELCTDFPIEAANQFCNV